MGPITIIGESINPTRRKKLTAALLSGEMDYIFELAKTQIETGADVLDVNVGAPGVDEVIVLPQVALAVAERFDVPICLDSSNRDSSGCGAQGDPRETPGQLGQR